MAFVSTWRCSSWATFVTMLTSQMCNIMSSSFCGGGAEVFSDESLVGFLATWIDDQEKAPGLAGWTGWATGGGCKEYVKVARTKGKWQMHSARVVNLCIAHVNRLNPNRSGCAVGCALMITPPLFPRQQLSPQPTPVLQPTLRRLLKPYGCRILPL